MSSVAVRPIGPMPAMSPASSPTFAGLLTPTPTSSNSGCFTTSARTSLPTNPVPHRTMRLAIEHVLSGLLAPHRVDARVLLLRQHADPRHQLVGPLPKLLGGRVRRECRHRRPEP